MKRRTITGGLGLMLLASVLLAVGNRAATTVWADPSSISWDVSMADPTHAAPPACTTNDGNGTIEPGECPDVRSDFSLQPEGGPGGSQSFFDLANVMWTTGPYDDPTPIDHTGDTIPDPSHGLVVNRPTTRGAKVGEISLEIQSSLLVSASLHNNIDDVILEDNDPQVTGQPIACGAADTQALQDVFELWNAITDASNDFVSAAETQDPDPSYPSGCAATGAIACAPKGVTMLPVLIPVIETAMGLPPDSLVSRSYGIAKLPLVGGIGSDVDVNFLVYSLHSLGIDRYLNLTLVQYPGLRSPDPTIPMYGPLAQTFQTCPPYQSSTTVYGVTAKPDFDEDGTPDLDVPPELNRLVICPSESCGPYDYTMYTSTAEDYDGDTIPAYADRCDTDPNSGSAAGDTDGDTLAGDCDINGEGNNPRAGRWNATPPWDEGQDVDGDTYVNYVDNCPTVPDADLDEDTVIDYQKDADGDGVGDVCDPAPAIPGDGSGY